MKTILLSFLLLGSVSSLFAQLNDPNYPCPIDIKSNQGGGNCPDLIFNGDTLKGTAVVTLTFAAPVTCAPKLISVKDNDDVTRILKSGLGTIQNAPNDNRVEYCLYGEQSADNFFNQPNLIATLDYNCPLPTSTTVRIRCLETGEEIGLPVNFKSFTATRSNSSSVAITWTTAQEQINKGFNVQKNVGGVWTTVAFVPSQALNGNSSSDLSYSYTDVNSTKGITQYRIQQVDLDGHSKYTDIRAVRGDGSVSKLVVYPNPSSDGKVNVVFEDNSGMRDVQVSDMQGKTIRSFKGITNNILVIERLTSGFYTIKVFNRNTSATSVEKVVIR